MSPPMTAFDWLTNSSTTAEMSGSVLPQMDLENQVQRLEVAKRALVKRISG
jgi:hypothetical protein